MKINCIIIEDEPLALERTKEFVLKVPYLELLKSFDNGLEAIGFLKEQDVQLIFLDIQMDDFSGIQLLESLERKPKVIITTAFDKYALKGFELNVSDYLLKPFEFNRFLQACERIHEELLSQAKNEDKHFLFVKTEYRLERVRFKDILFIEGMRDYRRIRLSDKKIMTLQTFKELELLLPRNLFCRVHKSYIVSFDKIESIERDRIKIQNELIPISETYREQFYKMIK
jgi:two-component system LytT family response regulator